MHGTRTVRRRAVLAVVGGLFIVAVGTAGLLAGVEPFTTAYYLFAWYGALLALDGLVAGTGGCVVAGRRRFLLLDHPRHALSLFLWSVPTWLLFEAANLRLRNWYYVFVPATDAIRWPAIAGSFATVLPAIFVTAALLRGLGVGRDSRCPELRLTPGRLRVAQAVGVAMLLLPMLWPRWFFPLVWGGVFLVLDPWSYRRDPARSILGDLERGEPGRAIRLLVAGALIGLLWELFNIEARGKWIYTVPGLEELKLFEMPVLGFLGFPPFALEGFAIWQALVLLGVAVPRVGREPGEVGTRRDTTESAGAGPGASPPGAWRARRRRLSAGALALAFSVTVLAAMEVRTVSSYRPRMAELPGVPAGRLDDAGYDIFRLAATDPDSLAARLAVPPERAAAWVAAARLATLRGIGTRNARRLRAAGVNTVEALAARDPVALAAALARGGGPAIPASRVRVWVRAARQAVASTPPR